MDRRAVGAVGLCVLVAVAGCSGLIGGDSTGTAGGADGGGPTGTLTYPDGYGPSGVVDGEAAMQSHADAVRASDNFTVVYRATVDARNRTTAINYTRRVDARERRSHLVSEISGAGRVGQYLANGTVYVRGESPDTGDVHYSSRTRDPDVASASGARFVRPLVSNVTYGPAERIERGGELALRYRGTDLDAPGSLLGEGVSQRDVTSFSATLVVDVDGLVRHAEYAATVRRDGGERSVSVTVEVTDLDATTVRRPDWVDEATG